jgi:citrate lyase subunit gamma (acyl carrier protein)
MLAARAATAAVENGRMSLTNVEATAGTSDRGDVFIRVTRLKSGSGIDIALESRVKSLYEKEILKTVTKTLKQLKISDMRVEIKDQAAFDYVIKARLETAVQRAFQAGKK